MSTQNILYPPKKETIPRQKPVFSGPSIVNILGASLHKNCGELVVWKGTSETLRNEKRIMFQRIGQPSPSYSDTNGPGDLSPEIKKVGCFNIFKKQKKSHK